MKGAAPARSSASSLMAWAITVVHEFQTAGQTIPNSAVALLPLVEVVLWYQRQSEPVEVSVIRKRFKVSRATAFRWLWVLRRMDDPTAISSALQLSSASCDTTVRRALMHSASVGEAG